MNSFDSEKLIDANNKDRRKKAAVFVVILLLIAGILFLTKQWWIPLFRAATYTKQNSSQKTPTADPISLSIPSLGINAPFIKLGLNPNRTLEVPQTSHEVGWYVYGAKPGDMGPAVVVGHKDSDTGQPAIFANLQNIKVGDEIRILRADNTTAVYKVDSFSKFSQDQFPTQDVYGYIEHEGIRVITCAGSYNSQRDRYTENLVVFGTLVK